MSAARDKGTKAETAIVRYLNNQGWPAVERRALGGAKDKGDVAGIRNTVIEAKRCTTMTLGPWIKEAEAERDNAGANVGVVWHWRRGKGSPADWFVTMTGADFVRLLKEAGR